MMGRVWIAAMVLGGVGMAQTVAAGAGKSIAEPPAYEVATIKPPGPNDYALPLRIYIQLAFGIPGNSEGWVIGPEWVNSATYVIRGKPTEPMQKAMLAMSAAERAKEERLMEQALLADRFKFKAHFETHEMPVYELVVAKGGSKLTEDLDKNGAQIAVYGSKIRGKAASVHALADALESTADIGRRIVVDKTGLSGTYDFLLKWTPMDAASAGGSGSSTDAEEVSLFAAIEEQLGLKLMATKGPGQVLVIDHIERPSEN